MTLASIARATAPRKASGVVCGPRGRAVVVLPAALLLMVAPTAFAQEFSSVSPSVTVDYSVLDALGNDPNLPRMLSADGQPKAPLAIGQAWPPQGGVPYAAGGHQGTTLLPPPPTAPQSTLTAGQPLGLVLTQPGASQTVKLIPPTQRQPAPAPAKAPTPAPAPVKPPEIQEAAAPTPPPPPTPVADTPSVPVVPAVATAASAPAPDAAEAEPQATEAFAAATATADAPVAEASVAEASAAEASVIEASASAAEAAPVPAPAAEAAAEATLAPAPETRVAEAPEAEPERETVLFPGADDESEDAAEATSDAEASGEPQAAALPAPATVEGQVSVTFGEGVSELSPEAMSKLDEVAERLRGDETLRVQLLAYAQAIDENTSRARRMSLSRALAVRSYLIEKGVRSTRMDVRALGANVEGEPADRVDIIPQAR